MVRQTLLSAVFVFSLAAPAQAWVTEQRLLSFLDNLESSPGEEPLEELKLMMVSAKIISSEVVIKIKEIVDRKGPAADILVRWVYEHGSLSRLCNDLIEAIKKPLIKHQRVELGLAEQSTVETLSILDLRRILLDVKIDDIKLASALADRLATFSGTELRESRIARAFSLSQFEKMRGVFQTHTLLRAKLAEREPRPPKVGESAPKRACRSFTFSDKLRNRT